MSTEVTDLINALRDGVLSLDEITERFRRRSWPRRAASPPTSYSEISAAEQQDPDPYVPNSFDDVVAAYDLGRLTDEEYEVLSDAIAESKRAEDRRKAGEPAEAE